MNKYIDTGMKIFDWVIRIYFILIILGLVYGVGTHPEYFNVVKERPARDSGTSLNDWTYRASTEAECKPLTKLYGFYDTWLKPFLILIVIYSGLNLFLRTNLIEKLNKYVPDDETKKPDDDSNKDIQAKQK